jgi:hypothetical protein
MNKLDKLQNLVQKQYKEQVTCSKALQYCNFLDGQGFSHFLSI